MDAFIIGCKKVQGMTGIYYGHIILTARLRPAAFLQIYTVTYDPT